MRIGVMEFVEMEISTKVEGRDCDDSQSLEPPERQFVESNKAGLVLEACFEEKIPALTDWTTLN